MYVGPQSIYLLFAIFNLNLTNVKLLPTEFPTKPPPLGVFPARENMDETKHTKKIINKNNFCGIFWIFHIQQQNTITKAVKSRKKTPQLCQKTQILRPHGVWTPPPLITWQICKTACMLKIFWFSYTYKCLATCSVPMSVSEILCAKARK